MVSLMEGLMNSLSAIHQKLLVSFQYKALGNYASNLALIYFFIIFNKIINMQKTITVNAGTALATLYAVLHIGPKVSVN